MNRVRKNKNPQNPKNSRVLRKLSPIEGFQSAGHSLRIYVGCAIACRYHVADSFQGPTDESKLENKLEHAIARAIVQHPLFTVGRINEASKKQYWVRLDHIDFNYHIKWQTISEGEDHKTALDAALDWQVNQRYTDLETRPQWRATILKSAKSDFVDVVFAWDHTVGDGKSGRFLHDSLLACLNEKPGSDIITLKDRSFEVPVTDFTPPLHHLIRLPVSLSFIFSTFSQDLISQSKSVKPPQTADWAPITMEPFKTRLKSTTLSNNVLKPVLDACRKQETTLTGLLHGLISVSMATRLAEDKARAFECGTPVCLRQFQKPGISKVDLRKTAINSVVYWPYVFEPGFVATVRQQVSDARANQELNKKIEDTVWSAAKSIREGLSAKLKLGARNDALGLAKFITDWKSYVMDHAKIRTHSWEVSNLGVMQGELPGDTGAEDCWRVEDATFTQSASVAGPALTLSVISVRGASLTLSCSWQIGVIDDGLAEGVSKDIEAWINGLGRNGCIDFIV
ncbi:hypothetical protein FLAG1_10181 [Fusarium langsethiae]|uniref:Alcohol acetyltransferase n=1 Tax=Fusarium langsethiae TaxID=179993 RepID=A0A0M9EPS7_FUSLA|nr:hypothetical protein FLAG1_10181 [Fusarium langsethiae]GKU07450.1 unnamed protein product [Fusarium langsethiae]GKU22483.1 unnamed protein product [Fusarium langsethiae]